MYATVYCSTVLLYIYVCGSESQRHYPLRLEGRRPRRPYFDDVDVVIPVSVIQVSVIPVATVFD